ncbi:MAG: hypothetical protein AAB456_00240 [Patescibacteria group bacterium]
MKPEVEITKLFSCGCKTLALFPFDITNQEPNEEAVLEHECKKVKIWRKKFSIRRFYVKNTAAPS